MQLLRRNLFIIHPNSLKGGYASTQLLRCNLFIIHPNSLKGGYASTRLLELSFIHNLFKFLGKSLVVSTRLLRYHFFIKTHPSSWKNACAKVLENIFGYTLFISLKLMKVSEKFIIIHPMLILTI